MPWIECKECGSSIGDQHTKCICGASLRKELERKDYARTPHFFRKVKDDEAKRNGRQCVSAHRPRAAELG